MASGNGKPKPSRHEVDGVKTVGIYEIEAKQIMVCYRVAPGERPTEFMTSEKSGRMLIIYKRVQ